MNNLGDLHNELFKQLQRVNNQELTGAALKDEIERSKAVSSIGQTIIGNAALIVKATLSVANSVGTVDMPLLIGESEDVGDKV